MYGGLPITVVPCAAISSTRDVPKSVTLRSPFSDTSMLPGRRSRCRTPRLVRVIDGVADLTGEIERAIHVERAVPHDDLLQGLASHVLHHDEKDVLLLFRGENRHDVRMAHGRQEPRLLQHLGEIEILLVRDLEGDLLVDPGIFRKVNGSEATAPEG